MRNINLDDDDVMISSRGKEEEVEEEAVERWWGRRIYSLHLEEGESWYAFNVSVRLSVCPSQLEGF